MYGRGFGDLGFWGRVRENCPSPIARSLDGPKGLNFQKGHYRIQTAQPLPFFRGRWVEQKE